MSNKFKYSIIRVKSLIDREKASKEARMATRRPWDHEDCHHFIFHECGQQEEFPRRLKYWDGTRTVIKQLGARYGFEYYDEFIEVFRTILEGPVEGESNASLSLWANWRAEYSITGVCVLLHAQCYQFEKVVQNLTLLLGLHVCTAFSGFDSQSVVLGFGRCSTPFCTTTTQRTRLAQEASLVGTSAPILCRQAISQV